MGYLHMTDSEQEYYELSIAESMKMLGQECLLYQVKTITSDIHQDRYITYKDPVKVNILFSDNPKTVLKNYNWYDEGQTPYAAYISNYDDDYDEIRVERDCIIEIPQTQYRRQEQYTDKRFIITTLSGSKIVPLFWVAKLVPYREKINMTSINDFGTPPTDRSLGYKYTKKGS